jgi:hypothetical protein
MYPAYAPAPEPAPAAYGVVHPADYGSEQAVHDSSWSVGSISLAELNESAELLTRVDNKYFVPAATFHQLIAALPELQVLEIDGRRTFYYESVYFDTPDLLTYRAHLQQRRRRFKVRTRTYVDSGLCMFEVKTTGTRGNTVKERIEYPVADRTVLNNEAYAFMARTLWEAFGYGIPVGMQISMVNLYRRTTFAAPSEGSRLTCDVAVSCHSAQASIWDNGSHVLVESKSANGDGQADRMLRWLGVRPVSVSKYCVGIAALYPGMGGNPWRTVLHRYFDQPTAAVAG